jgi:hypothetical protein
MLPASPPAIRQRQGLPSPVAGPNTAYHTELPTNAATAATRTAKWFIRKTFIGLFLHTKLIGLETPLTFGRRRRSRARGIGHSLRGCPLAVHVLRPYPDQAGRSLPTNPPFLPETVPRVGWATTRSRTSALCQSRRYRRKNLQERPFHCFVHGRIAASDVTRVVHVFDLDRFSLVCVTCDTPILVPDPSSSVLRRRHAILP